MTPTLEEKIPDTIDELLRGWSLPNNLEFREEDSKYRLTLIHKSGDRSYCFLSNGLKEIKPEEKMDVLSLSLSKKRRVEMHYDSVFHERSTYGGKYYVLEQAALSKEKPKVIPFLFNRELPSIVVDASLTKKINEYISLSGSTNIQALESLAENGWIRFIFSPSIRNSFKERLNLIREQSEGIRKEVSDLFVKEVSPSVFIQPKDYLPIDLKNKSMFTQPNKLALYGKSFYLMPLISIFPYDTTKQILTTELKRGYRSKFGQSEEEQEKVALSDFFIANPRVLGGFERLFEGVKNVSNFVSFGMLAGAQHLSEELSWEYVHEPLKWWMYASGATMLLNLISSRGRNSSGLVSSLIDTFTKGREHRLV